MFPKIEGENLNCSGTHIVSLVIPASWSYQRCNKIAIELHIRSTDYYTLTSDLGPELRLYVMIRTTKL